MSIYEGGGSPQLCYHDCSGTRSQVTPQGRHQSGSNWRPTVSSSMPLSTWTRYPSFQMLIRALQPCLCRKSHPRISGYFQKQLPINANLLLCTDSLASDCHSLDTSFSVLVSRFHIGLSDMIRLEVTSATFKWRTSGRSLGTVSGRSLE